MHARYTAEHYNPLQLGLKRILGNKNIAFYLQRLIWSPIRLVARACVPLFNENI